MGKRSTTPQAFTLVTKHGLRTASAGTTGSSAGSSGSGAACSTACDTGSMTTAVSSAGAVMASSTGAGSATGAGIFRASGSGIGSGIGSVCETELSGAGTAAGCAGIGWRLASSDAVKASIAAGQSSGFVLSSIASSVDCVAASSWPAAESRLTARSTAWSRVSFGFAATAGASSSASASIDSATSAVSCFSSSLAGSRPAAWGSGVASDASVPLKASRIAAVVIADVQPACVNSNSPADSHSDRQGLKNALLGSLVFIAMVFIYEACRAAPGPPGPGRGGGRVEIVEARDQGQLAGFGLPLPAGATPLVPAGNAG